MEEFDEELNQSKIEYVQINAMAAMKILKQVESERQSGGDVVGQGFLTGLSPDPSGNEKKRLEVTDCFTVNGPVLPNDDDPISEQKKEEEENKRMTDMLRYFRSNNIDFEIVGVYKTFKYGTGFDRDLFNDMRMYRVQNPDSIALIYDPVKTYDGSLSLKAYRLSMKALECLNEDMTPEIVKSKGLTYSQLFEELPVVLKYSHLTEALIAELRLLTVGHSQAPTRLEIAPSESLSKCVRQVAGQLEALKQTTQDINRYTINRQRAQQNLENLKQKRYLDNEQRKLRGEAELSMDDLAGSIKWPQLINTEDQSTGMLPSMIAANEVDASTLHAREVVRNNLAKLFVLESATHDSDKSKLRSSSSSTAQN